MNACFFVTPSRDQEREDFRTALQQPAVRRIFRRVLSTGNLMGASHADNDRNTAYNEGLRAVAAWFASNIEAAEPCGVAELMRESVADRLMWNMANKKEQ